MIIKRKYYLEKIRKYYKKPLIKVITWLRRSWKSIFLKTIFEELVENKIYTKNQIFYINKELLEFDNIKTYVELNEAFLKWKKENTIWDNFVVAIDEIQEIKEWEKFVNSIFAEYGENIDIFITWSNSHLLSSSLSTYIAWRYIEFEIYPLNFSEYCEFEKSHDYRKAFLEYIKYWWLPWIFKLDKESDIVYDYLKWVYNTIFVKDVLNYNKVKNSYLFEKLYEYILKNIWNIFNSTNIRNYIKNENISASVDTIIDYISYGCKSYIINEVNRYDIKGKKLFQISNKYYAWDIWIRNAIVGFNFKEDISYILENIVFLELKKRWYSVNIWILQDKEIDFIATKNNEIIYIQVCYLLSSQWVIDREFNNLLQIKDNWTKYVLSMDDIFETKFEGIIHKNIINWCLDK